MGHPSHRALHAPWALGSWLWGSSLQCSGVSHTTREYWQPHQAWCVTDRGQHPENKPEHDPEKEHKGEEAGGEKRPTPSFLEPLGFRVLLRSAAISAGTGSPCSGFHYEVFFFNLQIREFPSFSISRQH